MQPARITRPVGGNHGSITRAAAVVFCLALASGPAYGAQAEGLARTDTPSARLEVMKRAVGAFAMRAQGILEVIVYWRIMRLWILIRPFIRSLRDLRKN